MKLLETLADGFTLLGSFALTSVVLYRTAMMLLF